jgi:hypothetical protein
VCGQREGRIDGESGEKWLKKGVNGLKRAQRKVYRQLYEALSGCAHSSVQFVPKEK